MAVLGGCGEERFDADSAIEALNEAGADLRLGESLQASSEEVEIRVVEFAEAGEPGEIGGGSEEGHDHGGGALVVLADEAAAEQEFARCDAAISFTCYRAGNVVLRFSELDAEEQARVVASLQRLQAAE